VGSATPRLQCCDCGISSTRWSLESAGVLYAVGGKSLAETPERFADLPVSRLEICVVASAAGLSPAGRGWSLQSGAPGL